MISDEDLEKLAREEMNKRWKDIGPDAYFREQLALEYKRGCCAGFRAAEKIMAEKWPTIMDINDKATEITNPWSRVDHQEAAKEWIAFHSGINWLKQKLLGDGK